MSDKELYLCIRCSCFFEQILDAMKHRDRWHQGRRCVRVIVPGHRDP